MIRAPGASFHPSARRARTCLALALLGAAALPARAPAGPGAQPPEAVLPVVASTVPANGDLNPYGVAFVPRGFPAGGAVAPGDLLVSNFNDSQNLQGTGTTIVKFSPDGQQALFFQGTPPLGLTTALEVLKAGFVLVGNFPSTDGTCGNASPGSILVLDRAGKLLSAVSAPELNGPWDSTLDDGGGRATLFVSSALTGTVLRYQLTVGGGGVAFSAPTVVASGYAFRCDPVTFVVAPTGLVYDAQRDRLFVASTGDNAVYAVEDAGHRTSSAGPGQVIYQDAVHLHGPLAMVGGPFGHLFVSNNDGVNPDPAQPSELVEFTTDGQFLRQLSVDPAPGGAFGLNFDRGPAESRFAYVDDNANDVTLWTIPGEGLHQ